MSKASQREIDPDAACRRPRAVGRLVAAAAAVIFSAPAFMILSREATPILLIVVCLLLGCAGHLSDDRRSDRAAVGMAHRAAGAALVALLCYMLISIAWSPAPWRGLEFLAHVSGAVLVTYLALTFTREIRATASPGMCAVLLGLAAMLLLIELTAGAPLRTAVGASGDLWKLNRAAVALVLLMLIVLDALLVFGRRSGALALLLIVAAAVFASESETAKLAALVGATAWCVVRVLPFAGPSLIGGAVLLVHLGAPLMAANLSEVLPASIDELIPYGTLRIRADIWEMHALLVPERLLLGHGLEASHVAASLYADRLGDAETALLNFGHPHNFSIQVWFELGVVGAVLSGLVIATAIAVASQSPTARRSSSVACAAAIYAIAAVSHGAWQAWWWCLVGLLLVSVAIIGEASRKSCGTSPKVPIAPTARSSYPHL